MSFWTHIVGVMHVETYAEVDDIKAYVEEALKGAPKITGSEMDASVFVNIEPWHNVSTNCDCGRCQYKETLKFYDDGFECDAPDGYRCPYGEYKTRAVITIQGDLRDRMKQRTKKEWNAFHRYIAKKLKWTIRLATCRIEGW